GRADDLRPARPAVERDAHAVPGAVREHPGHPGALRPGAGATAGRWTGHGETVTPARPAALPGPTASPWVRSFSVSVNGGVGMRWAVLLVVFGEGGGCVVVVGAGGALVGGAGARARDRGKRKKEKKGRGELPPPAGAPSALDVVKRTNAARREYEESLRELRAHYLKVGDKQRV